MLTKTIEEVKEVLPVNISLGFPDFFPYLLRAEENEVENLLGLPLYDDIQTKYDTDTLSAKEAKLLSYCRRISCNLAYVYALPMLQVQTSSQGIQIVSNENKKTAFQWQIRNIENSHTDAAYEAVEKAMSFLDANGVDFPLWANSNSYANIAGAYVQNIKELEALISIRTSYLLFREITPQIRKWDASIRKLIGVSVLTPEGTESAKRYVAFMAVAETRGLGIDNGGLHYRAAASADMEAKESAPLDAVKAFQDDLKAQAAKELAAIDKELNPTGSGGIFDNKQDSKFFAL